MSFHQPPLSEHQRELLRRYEALLRDPGAARGMVGRADVPKLWERHITDSLRGAATIPSAARRVADLGSGGGLPGVVLAVALPEIGFVLAERRRNRISFLELVCGELDLTNADVHPGDARDLPEGSFDVTMARAFADPERTWSVAEPLLTEAGRLVYWAGSSLDLSLGTSSWRPPRPRIEVFAEPGVAGSGPLVIMSRQ
jgi:16S rRNA (guanine527-N7)-methyltransferase